MMNIAALTAAGASGADRQTDQAKADLDYDSFLRLLVATMQNQDPTAPNDPSETLSQLASFSTVEQAIKSNDRLDRLLAVTTAGQAASWIGQELTSSDGAISGDVAAVEISDGRLIAILEDGSRVAIENGIRIG